MNYRDWHTAKTLLTPWRPSYSNRIEHFNNITHTISIASLTFFVFSFAPSDNRALGARLEPLQIDGWQAHRRQIFVKCYLCRQLLATRKRQQQKKNKKQKCWSSIRALFVCRRSLGEAHTWINAMSLSCIMSTLYSGCGIMRSTLTFCPKYVCDLRRVMPSWTVQSLMLFSDVLQTIEKFGTTVSASASGKGGQKHCPHNSCTYFPMQCDAVRTH